MNLKRFLSLRKARENSLEMHFFDNVYFDAEELEAAGINEKVLKDDIMDWMTRLKNSKNISINKFSDLFSKFEEIMFPITLYGRPHSLKIKDSIGNKYYLHYFQLDYAKLGEYSIGKRFYPYDKEFGYCLKPENEVTLTDAGIIQLNENGNNGDHSLYIIYNYQSDITAAILNTKTLELQITYPLSNHIYDEEISMYLFEIANQFKYVDDVSFILKHLLNVLKTLEEKYSLTITSYMPTNNKRTMLSEISLTHGIVTNYSFSTRPSDSQICLTQMTICEDLEIFISNHQF